MPPSAEGQLPRRNGGGGGGVSFLPSLHHTLFQTAHIFPPSAEESRGAGDNRLLWPSFSFSVPCSPQEEKRDGRIVQSCKLGWARDKVRGGQAAPPSPHRRDIRESTSTTLKAAGAEVKALQQPCLVGVASHSFFVTRGLPASLPCSAVPHISRNFYRPPLLRTEESPFSQKIGGGLKTGF